MKLMMLVCACSLLALPSSEQNVSFKQFHSVESYEIQPGILVMPVYSANGKVCELSVERRHYWDNKVNIDAEMSRDLIWQFFDQLAPREQRGAPGLNLHEGTEIGDVDGGVRAIHVVYENVSLTMYGKAESQDFVNALITWNNKDCGAH